jgi:hypothetical protein
VAVFQAFNLRGFCSSLAGRGVACWPVFANGCGLAAGYLL